jgi:hypothetical protein
MLQIFQSLGRLSIRGYLVIAGLVAITILLNYGNLQGQLEIAARQAQQRASERAESKSSTLKETDAAPKSSPAVDGASVSGSSQNTTSTQQATPPNSPSMAISSTVVQAPRIINGGALVLSPLNITVALGQSLPLISISSPDGAAMSAPSLIGAGAQLFNLTPKNGAPSNKATWSMQPSGKPAPGLYKLQLKATAPSGIDAIEYTGTLNVLVLL